MQVVLELLVSQWGLAPRQHRYCGVANQQGI